MANDAQETIKSGTPSTNTDINKEQNPNTGTNSSWYKAVYTTDNIGYSLVWTVLGASSALLVAAVACPAMIPFAFAQSSLMIKLATATFAGSAYYLLPQAAKPNLHNALLGTVAIASVGFVATLFLAPAMLPFGLAAVATYSAWLQAAISAGAALTAVAATTAMFGLWKRQPTSETPKSENDKLSTIDPNLSTGCANAEEVTEEEPTITTGLFGNK